MRVLVSSWLALAFCVGCGDAADGGGEPGSDAGTDAGPPPSVAREYSDSTSLGGPLSHFHNPDDNSIDLKNVATLSLDYKLDTRGTVTGTAIGAGGVVYVNAQDGIYAITPETGEILWQNSDWGSPSTPTFADGVLYTHATLPTGGSFLVALAEKDGAELWRTETYDHPAAAPYSSPKLSKDLAVVGISGNVELQSDPETVGKFKGSVVAVDRETGDIVWRHWTTQDPYSGATLWSTVSIDEEAGLVFASTGNNYVGDPSTTSDAILALDLATGDVIWATQLEADDVWSFADTSGPDDDFGANPIVYDADLDGTTRKFVAAGQKSGVFSALDREDGALLWQVKLGPGNQLTGGVLNNGAYDGTRIYVACNDPAAAANTRLYALDPATGDEVWSKDLDKRVWGPLTVQQGVLFVPRDTQMTAYDPANGEQLYDYSADGTITTAALAYGGRLFFGNGVQWIMTTAGTGMNVLSIP